ncbi:DUF4402 domain-containing protein [Aliifodinibius sp. S!AR15-10]|uniref:DUF4402 domain-containing protein n=1 Tax=Aliifodinibius sp. S!AR15-10 TaxID=2950437 RepID=UPI002866CBAD|nr:DUF4402 domain-containing protein [Aliifodinibius sp. S!AR15-10]MDR8390855.1 DUF4402 domain-containing protein [Aliifodinibius sp. S!AR15-10]
MILFNPTSAVAQDELSINVSAEVISSIEMITLKSMRLSGAEANNNIIEIDPTTSANAGKMVAYGTPNSEIRISYLPSRELTRMQGTESLTFNYQIAGNQQEDQVSAEIMDVENRDFSFNEDGQFFLWIGGSVNISSAVPGNYQGDFTLEIEYI